MPVKNIIPGQRVTKEKLERARELRREMTSAEKILWEELRRKPPCPSRDIPSFSQFGLKSMLKFIFRKWGEKRGVDFYCHKAGLVIELDGSVHEEETQKESDARKDKALNELGLRIVRFRNEEVLMDMSRVVSRIQELISIL